MMGNIRLGAVTHLVADMRHDPKGTYWCTRCAVRFKRILGLDGWKTEHGVPIDMSPGTEIDCMACIAASASCMARYPAIEMRGSRIVHALWLEDAEHDSGERAVVALCGTWASPEDVEETDAPVDCMACLVDPRRHGDEG